MGAVFFAVIFVIGFGVIYTALNLWLGGDTE